MQPEPKFNGRVIMLQDKFAAIEKELNTRFINREDEIHGLTLAALAGKHIELLGPPGTAKSMLVRAYSEYLDARRFQWLLTQFTTPDEIFGPISIQALKQEMYKRVPKGKLPEAEVVFLDEIYKASSAILNTMLTVLEERIWFNDSEVVKIPLIFCVGASNELPSTDEGLAALRDRFLLRFNVSQLQSPEHFSQLLALRSGKAVVAEAEHISPQELADAQSQVRDVPFNKDVLVSLQSVWAQVREKGIFPSDRRFVQTMDVMRAQAWYLGDSEVTSEAIVVAEDILWEKPEQIRDVKSIVRSCVNPGLLEAQSLVVDAIEAVESLMATGNPEDGDIIEVRRQLLMFREKMESSSKSGKVATIRGLMDKILQVLLDTAMERSVSARMVILRGLLTNLKSTKIV